MREIVAENVKKKKDHVLRDTNFLLLFLGGLVSRLGNGIHHIGLVWYIMEINGSGLAVGTVLMLASIPGVILGPFSGVLVDRFSRKKIIVWMDVIRGVIVLAMGFMILTQTMNYGYLILGTVLLGICGAFFNPAVSASIPNIVRDEHLNQANSLEHLSMNITGVAGPALGGILIAIWGVAGVFFINGISFLLSALSETFIKFPPRANNNSSRKIEFVKEMKEAISFFADKKVLFHLLKLCLFANFLFAGSAVVGLPLIVRDVLQGTAKDLGVVEAAWPIGAALGGLILTLLPEFKKAYKIFTSSLAIQTFFWVIIGIISLPVMINNLGVTYAKYMMLFLLVLCGIFNAFINVPVNVIFQRMIPDDKRGRIFSFTATISQGLVPVSIGLSGLITNMILPGYLFVFVGVGMVILILDFIRKEEARDF